MTNPKPQGPLTITFTLSGEAKTVADAVARLLKEFVPQEELIQLAEDLKQQTLNPERVKPPNNLPDEN